MRLLVRARPSANRGRSSSETDHSSKLLVRFSEKPPLIGWFFLSPKRFDANPFIEILYGPNSIVSAIRGLFQLIGIFLKHILMSKVFFHSTRIDFYLL
jgi:hypothetical protein